MITIGVEYGVPYVLTGPDGTRAVFNNYTDPDYVGILSPESSGLDSPDTREDAANRVQEDGGIHGTFFYGRRPIVLQGAIRASSATQRNERVDKLRRASNAMRLDAKLFWEPAGGPTGGVEILVRRQQPLRITSGFNKDFMLALVAEDPRIYAHIPSTATFEYSEPLEGKYPEGPSNPGTATGWTNSEKAKTNLTDYANASGSEASPTAYLKLTNFGFAVPAEATVLGIGVDVWKSCSISPTTPVVAYDKSACLIRAGVVEALFEQDRALSGGWNSAPAAKVTYGSESDKWGGSWTPADINDPTFGFALMGGVKKLTIDTYASFEVYEVKMSIYYGLGGEQHKQTITTKGQIPTPAIIKAYGASTYPTVFTNNTTDQSIVLHSISKKEHYLELNTSARSVLLDGTEDWYKYIYFPQTGWWNLAPGENFLEFPQSKKITISWRDAVI